VRDEGALLRTAPRRSLQSPDAPQGRQAIHLRSCSMRSAKSAVGTTSRLIASDFIRRPRRPDWSTLGRSSRPRALLTFSAGGVEEEEPKRRVCRSARNRALKRPFSRSSSFRGYCGDSGRAVSSCCASISGRLSIGSDR
jgi:hypothetical protein